MTKNGNNQTVDPESIQRAIVQKKRDEIASELEGYIKEANQNIAAMRGALQAYDLLLNPPVEEEEVSTPAEPISKSTSAKAPLGGKK